MDAESQRHAGREPRGRHLACLALLAALALAPARALAHGAAAPADLTELSLDQLGEVQVVYAASRFEQSLAEVPASVTIVTADEIRAHGHRTLAEVLRSVRGFTVTNDRNYEYVGVRGFARLGDYNTHLLLLVDGHRVNDNVYDQAVIGLELPLDLAQVDRVEIVRGPGSSVYGTSAVLGVVNLVTRRPAGAARVEAEGSLGSYEEHSGRVRWSGPLGRRATLDLSASSSAARGPDLFYAEFADPAPEDGLANGLDHERFENLYARLDAGALRVQAFRGFRVKGIPTGSFGTLLQDRRNLTRDAFAIVQGQYEWETAGGLDFTARATYQEHGYYGDYAYDYGAPGTPEPGVFRDAGVGRWWDATVGAHARLGRGHHVAGGLEFRHDLQIDQWGLDPLGLYLDDHRTQRTWSAFAQYRAGLGEHFGLQLDVRHDRSDDFAGQTNPRAALVWSPGPLARLKAIFGRAFRVPNPFERFYASDVNLAAGELRPERDDTWELVAEREWESGWRASAGAFHYEVDRLVTLAPDSTGAFLQFRNEGAMRVRGLEAEVRGPLGPARAGLSVTLQDAVDDRTGDVPPNAPHHVAKADATVPLRSPRLLLGASAEYLSPRLTLLGNRTGDVVLVHANLSAAIVPGHADLSFGVRNLLDFGYGDPGTIDHLQDVIPQNGRTWRLRLTVRP